MLDKNIINWILLSSGVLFNASASILIKIATVAPYHLSFYPNPLSLIRNIPFIVGLISYALALIFYVYSLGRLPLSIAHPVLTSGSIGLVSLVSWAVFGDSFDAVKLIGILSILFGVIILTARN